MPHPRADLLQQMPHPGEDKVVKCPTNAPRGCPWLELTEPESFLHQGMYKVYDEKYSHLYTQIVSENRRLQGPNSDAILLNK